MKVSKVIGTTQVEVEGKDLKDCFAAISEACEIFSLFECGNCESRNVVPSVREVDGNTYYEMRCTACGATHGFGQRRSDGKLFPRRKDKSGQWIPNNGWTVWRRDDADDEAFA